jgi:hypothetical protein
MFEEIPEAVAEGWCFEPESRGVERWRMTRTWASHVDGVARPRYRCLVHSSEAESTIRSS